MENQAASPATQVASLQGANTSLPLTQVTNTSLPVVNTSLPDANASLPVASLNPTVASLQVASLPTVLKTGILQILNELNKDTQFKQMIADKSTDFAYSAIEEKSAKSTQIISDLTKLKENFEKGDYPDFESLKLAVAKFNENFTNILGGRIMMTGGRGLSRSRGLGRLTRRKSFSRAFRKTHGRIRNFQ
jgi:hypothetical protein